MWGRKSKLILERLSKDRYWEDQHWGLAALSRVAWRLSCMHHRPLMPSPAAGIHAAPSIGWKPGIIPFFQTSRFPFCRFG